MGGIELDDGVLTVDRAPNELDERAIEFSRICDDLGIAHVYVAGYVAILAGRSRSTQDIDVLVEPMDETRVDALVARLEAAGFWGPAMPLSSMQEAFEHGDNIWVGREEEVIPHLEVKQVADEFDRASLREAIQGRIGGETLPIGPLELQIAYKLYLGTRTDFEDAVHLYTLFGGSLSTEELQRWVERLDVRDEYERLTAV